MPQPSGVGYSFIRSWGKEGETPGDFRAPIGIAIAGEEIFVSDARNNRIEVFDTNGRFLRMFGREGEGPRELVRPMHLDFREGRLYVAEYLNDRIQVFAPSGEPLRVIGGAGSGPGQFDALAGSPWTSRAACMWPTFTISGSSFLIRMAVSSVRSGRREGRGSVPGNSTTPLMWPCFPTETS